MLRLCKECRNIENIMSQLCKECRESNPGVATLGNFSIVDFECRDIEMMS